MAHALESLVFVPLMLGTLLFLHEFLADDDLLAFMVLTTTWSADLFALLYTRTSITGVYFSRLFFAYGAAFHLYALAHPHGFTYSAFATYALLTAHAALWLYNRAEVPAREERRRLLGEARANQVPIVGFVPFNGFLRITGASSHAPTVCVSTRWSQGPPSPGHIPRDAACLSL